MQPSLRNIFNEIESEHHKSIESRALRKGDLEEWAEQGVLLLNSTLTVESGIAGSHGKFGWGVFTAKIIEKVLAKKKNLVLMLWGKWAQESIPPTAIQICRSSMPYLSVMNSRSCRRGRSRRPPIRFAVPQTPRSAARQAARLGHLASR